MHFELKSISKESIPEALAKVERYRLLNEPSLAESICLDILAIMPDHQQALISLLLARTDQFHSHVNAKAAREALTQIKGDYEPAYYEGLIWDRLGNPNSLRCLCSSNECKESVDPADGRGESISWGPL